MNIDYFINSKIVIGCDGGAYPMKVLVKSLVVSFMLLSLSSQANAFTLSSTLEKNKEITARESCFFLKGRWWCVTLAN